MIFAARSRLLQWVVVLAAGCGVPASPAPESGPLADIAILSSDSFDGREVATAGNDSAAIYLARRYQALKLLPAFHSACASSGECAPSFFQPFRIALGVAHNVGAIVIGSDSALRLQFVVIGAHYDHLGHSSTHARDRESEFALRPGADDNASGTAAVLELARRLAMHPARRSVLVLNFDAEEEGLFGSLAFVQSGLMPTAGVGLMLNLDMIGRLRSGRLLIEGVPAKSTLGGQVDSLVHAGGLNPVFIADDHRSDHAPFARAGIPVVFLTTGEHDDYHTARDIATRINGRGVLTIIDIAEHIARMAADQ